MSSSSNTGGERPSSRANNRIEDTKSPAKPDLYYGDRNKLEDWFNQLGLYFMLTRTPAEHRTVYAVSFLRGRAQHYVKPLMTKFLDNKTDPEGIFRDYSTFKTYMKEVFGVTNEENQAVRIIQSLQQKTSAAEYSARFREYANLTDWKGSALMAMYRKGLKENVKDELMRSGASHNTLEELIEDAIEKDDMLYERAMERRHLKGGRVSALPGRSGGGNRGDPMEIDNIQKGRSKKKGGGKGKGSKGLKCWTCEKLGHMSRNCKSKNKVQRKQLNMMQHRNWSPPPDDEFRARRLHLILQCLLDEMLTVLDQDTEESGEVYDQLSTAHDIVGRHYETFRTTAQEEEEPKTQERLDDELTGDLQKLTFSGPSKGKAVGGTVRSKPPPRSLNRKGK